MAVKKKSERRIKKENYWKRLQVVAEKYKNVLFIDADNVSSSQVQKIRLRLRPLGAIMVMGKNVSTRTTTPTYSAPPLPPVGGCRYHSAINSDWRTLEWPQ
jgi:hypothetical protein